jgi:molybdopterin synthase catalytic subunit
MAAVLDPQARDHVALVAEAIDLTALLAWATRPSAGAVVTFSGVVRDHADGRDGVHALTYEAYDEPAVDAMRAIVADARTRWTSLECVALVHRTGRLELGEASVVVVVSSPHRAEAFEAARLLIDTLKTSVPIWKQEHWEGGEGWAVDAQPLRSVPRVDEQVG